MNWKFWQKNGSANDGQGLSRPKDLPEAVGRHLVVDLNLDPDWVWTLKAALRPRAGEQMVKDIRIFNPARAVADNVTVRNYTSLDAHPDLILYEGWFHSKTHKMQITEKTIEKAA